MLFTFPQEFETESVIASQEPGYNQPLSGAIGDDSKHQFPSTSADSDSRNSDLGLVIVTSPIHLSRPASNQSDSIETATVAVSNTDAVGVLLSSGTPGSGEAEGSSKQNLQRSALSLVQQSSPRKPAESSAIAAFLASSPQSTNVFTTKTLESLLKCSEEGKEIIEYAAKAELSEAKQLELSSIIARHHLDTRSKLLIEDLRTYALAVTSLFKFERLVGLIKGNVYYVTKKCPFSNPLHPYHAFLVKNSVHLQGKSCFPKPSPLRNVTKLLEIPKRIGTIKITRLSI